MSARRAFLVGLAAGAAASALPLSARAQAARKLTIGYVPSTLFAPVFVAVERGYLREAGLEAELTPIVAGQDAMVLVSQGRLDIAAAALSAAFFNAADRNLTVRFVASTAYQPRRGYPSALLVRQDLWNGGLRTLPQLRGKRIAWIGGRGAAGFYYVERVLRPAHLGTDAIVAIDLPSQDQGPALASKAVDAVFTASPFTEFFQREGLAHLIGTVPPGISASGIFFGPTLLNDHALARKVMAAFRRAAAEIAGPAYYAPANLAIFNKYTKLPVATLRSAPRYEIRPDLPVDIATLEDMQRVYASQGVLAYREPIDPGRLVARF